MLFRGKIWECSSATREVVWMLQKEAASGQLFWISDWLSASDGKRQEFRDKEGKVISFSASCAL